jgi:creatinase
MNHTTSDGPALDAAGELRPVQHMRNGEKHAGTFSAAEMQRRQHALRALSERLDLDAALLTSYHNINYFADFMYCAFGRRYAFVLTGDKAVCIAPAIDAGQPWRRVRGDALSYTDWHRDNYLRALRRVLGTPRRIGIECDHVSCELRRELELGFPDAELVDIGEPTMWLRAVKSAEEIALIAEGARIAELGAAAMVEVIGQGVPEYEVALAGTQAMVRAIARSFPDAELMDTWSWFQSGINTDGAHNPVTSRRLVAGDILSLNCFPMIAGYYTALERTLFLDHASDAHLRIWRINCEVHRRGAELLRPGARCCDVAAELNAIYREHGLLAYRSFGYGHSFGVLSHYYGREAGVELREDVDTVLAPGMVVSMEPMLTLPRAHPGAGGYREHDIFAITDTGARNLTAFPFGPEHNIVASRPR